MCILTGNFKDFYQVVHSRTHISGSCIDHIHVQKDTVPVCDARVIPVSYSHHAAIQIKIKM